MSEPIRMTEKIERVRVYWACTIPKHRHMTEEVAARCIAKKRMPKKWTRERIIELGKLREGGMTFKAVGQRFGVGSTRAAQIFWRYLRLKEKD